MTDFSDVVKDGLLGAVFNEDFIAQHQAIMGDAIKRMGGMDKWEDAVRKDVKRIGDTLPPNTELAVALTVFMELMMMIIDQTGGFDVSAEINMDAGQEKIN